MKRRAFLGLAGAAAVAPKDLVPALAVPSMTFTFPADPTRASWAYGDYLFTPERDYVVTLPHDRQENKDGK